MKAILARVAPAFLALALSGAPSLAEPGPAKPAAERPGPAVSVVEAVRREIAETIVVTGTLVPRDEILVTPEIEGYRVTEVLVEEGMRVEGGQVLARLSRDLIDRQLAQQNALVDKARAAIPQARSTIEQAEAAEIEARLSHDRARQLLQTGNATAAVMETRTAALRQAEGKLAFARNGLVIARADLAQAEAVRDELQLRLARTEIRAPEGGIVSRRTARVGLAASASAEPLFRLIARGEIELEGEVIETKLPLVSEGRPAWIEIGDGERVAGSVRAVYPEVDKATRLGKVRVRLDPDRRLRIGTFVRGAVEIARTRGVTVPQAAILYGGGKRSSVLVVAGDTVEAREVRTGLSNDDDVEIRSGLGAGERVVARAGSFLRDGDRVRPVLVASEGPSVAGAPSPRDTAEAGLP
ncbi:efflux RND transporter periplasmic adaptor subunit [Methylobacterium oxalidis]|uniref:Hemolysin secretion protein D n=1 Tax=Methylobacterium oxalidis TaxID=944322 RepID=A0A512J1T2_9HYPH|nr:efflux RND transporter periplasmic adaptor subunit [Methylobacterium oxalidis]GEP03921.1 hemolysin secretion protein D [Methylobacterium oxalidis]GJE31203.1 Efflux pump periplasmic linker BepF [Methylobacterium oxalidis]GLS65220.1 hemolysin secretion protein D [Methylobacterium oxalidis]